MKNLKNIQESDKTFSSKRQQQSRKVEQNLKHISVSTSMKNKFTFDVLARVGMQTNHKILMVKMRDWKELYEMNKCTKNVQRS